MKLLSLILTPVFLFTLFSLPIAQTGCNTTEPEEDNIQPGRRDYVWTVDTLETIEGNMFLFEVWGSSANDVWAAGDAYRNANTMWHYDGVKWTCHPPYIFVNPSAIWGSANNDIWLASTDSWLWHYDGSSWKRFSEIKLNDYFHFVIEAMYGSGSDDIYGFGFADHVNRTSHKAIVLHFDGTKWDFVEIPEMKTNFFEALYQKSIASYFITASNHTIDEPYSLYLFNKKDLKKIKSANSISLGYIGEEVSIRLNENVYYYNNGELQLIPHLSYKGIGRIWGRNKNDVFIQKLEGFDHYNGKDIVNIFDRGTIDWMLNTACIFEKDVFFIYQNTLTGKTIMIHGKLK